jgi:hypothetical protein
MRFTPKEKQAKYRPVLTANMIEYILKLAKTESPISNDSIDIISVLAPFQAKIQNSGIIAAYTEVERLSLEESLGFPVSRNLPSLGPTREDAISCPENLKAGMSKEEYWAWCYARYKISPEVCSLDEIQSAQEHRYLNDLMSPEEIAAFEEPKEK